MMKSIKQLALTLVLAVMSINIAQAVAPAGKQVIAAIALQGGSESAIKWLAPYTRTYKVHVYVPKTGTTTNALYRVYPKGKRAGSTSCVSADINYPCFEVSVDQTQYPNSWVQLTLNSDVATQWDFIRNKGYVTAVASNLGAAELLNLSALARFEDTVRVIGKTYQGGIIFYIDRTGAHGLIAAPTDQSDGIEWNNGSLIEIGATGTGLFNTNKIVTVQGAGSYAAMLCFNLVIGAYSDWYLPSKDELNLMYQNIGPGAAEPLTNIGGFFSAYYWSSSETAFSNAWAKNFIDDIPYNSNKSFTHAVRAVRAF